MMNVGAQILFSVTEADIFAVYDASFFMKRRQFPAYGVHGQASPVSDDGRNDEPLPSLTRSATPDSDNDGQSSSTEQTHTANAVRDTEMTDNDGTNFDMQLAEAIAKFRLSILDDRSSPDDSEITIETADPLAMMRSKLGLPPKS